MTISELSDSARSLDTPTPTLAHHAAATNHRPHHDDDAPGCTMSSKPPSTRGSGARGGSTTLKSSNSLRDVYKNREELVFPFRKKAGSQQGTTQRRLACEHARTCTCMLLLHGWYNCATKLSFHFYNIGYLHNIGFRYDIRYRCLSKVTLHTVKRCFCNNMYNTYSKILFTC